ncbi:hypothetical protein IVB12_10430 [Bradyrhizobium sp. 179]|uniref:hypothetical protein n=1 Tax=Bradyrhizobium sp. 179 TaxID=2782648 RepID=UPI001FF9F656|nr:hypothetical protein [Bradyrhizobium sp. 179]MCK1542365.1 hypothetical protein [Bradyrhizobium sp. 179]
MNVEEISRHGGKMLRFRRVPRLNRCRPRPRWNKADYRNENATEPNNAQWRCAGTGNCNPPVAIGLGDRSLGSRLSDLVLDVFDQLADFGSIHAVERGALVALDDCQFGL